MNDARLETILREALSDEPPCAVDSAVSAAIRREAARRRAVEFFFRWTRRIAAAAAIVALAAIPLRQRTPAQSGADITGDGEIMLEIIGFASPGDFYAEE